MLWLVEGWTQSKLLVQPCFFLSTPSDYQELKKTAAETVALLGNMLTAKEKVIVFDVWVCGRRNPAEQEINNEPATTSQWAANWENSLCIPQLIHASPCSGVPCNSMRVQPRMNSLWDAQNVHTPRESCSLKAQSVLMAPTLHHRKQRRTARCVRLLHVGSHWKRFRIKTVRKKSNIQCFTTRSA